MMGTTDRRIILPGDPEFDYTLGVSLPPNWGQVAHDSGGQFVSIARADSGILETVAHDEFVEYLNGGEYDQRLAEIGGEDFDDEDFSDEWECGDL